MKDLSVNKRAQFDYEISEKFSAGIQLTGHEAKSVKMGRVDIAGAHAVPRGGEIFVVGMNVPSFQPNNIPADYEPERTRKLLLQKEEIKTIIGKIRTGLTIVPLRVYTERGFVKIELGLGKGRKKHDKRELIKKRETEREIRGHVGL